MPKNLVLPMRYISSSVVLGIALISEVASAQMGPGMGGGGMGGPAQPAGEEKKEGVAEEAPKTPGLLPTTPALPPAKGRRKRWKLLELDGYFRLRTDWFKNFNLGFNSDPALGGGPFPRALGCGVDRAAGGATNAPCNDSLASTNMRLRLEPTFNIDEGTSVHVQADVLDNLVLGSTPTTGISPGFTTGLPPNGAFNTTQDPPVQGVNSDRDSIVIKRAWAEVAVPLGILKFGRMPNHWGMGIYANGGGRDPINGTYDYDADYGDTVDRLSFSTTIPGTSLRGMVATDWNSTRLVSNQTSANLGREGHPYDLDDSDDATSWIGVISHMDTPQEFRDAVDRGERVVNYGVYFEYKTQSWDDNTTGFTPGGTFDATAHYVPRDAKTYTASLWGKFGTGAITLEGELVGQFGSIKHLDDFGFTRTADIRKAGGAARMIWRGDEGKLRLGIEGGFATGDQWDNTPQGNTNIAFANRLGDPALCNASSCTLTQFMFNREYKIDLIMWRHLMGAVTNAAYAKPFLQYDLTKSIMFRASNVTSFALKSVATPGNGTMYGTEFDGDLGYNGSRFFAGVSYGVLFPFGAMAHPQDSELTAGPGFGYGAGNVGDPSTAHTIQMRLVLAF
ncbi:MAG TPA: TIGR04551 family protein [Gammaproteobacteria bacterium]|nr:TIGR04551 family protein [Gammaproteobacteria bacterium]